MTIYIVRIKILMGSSLEISVKLLVVLMLSVLMDFKSLLDINSVVK